MQLEDRAESATFQPPGSELAEEALDGVGPGGRGRREVQVEARMPRKPAPYRRRLVGSIVVEDQVQIELCRRGLVDPAQEADELDGAVLEHALADPLAAQDVERGEEGRGAVALVVV